MALTSGFKVVVLPVLMLAATTSAAAQETTVGTLNANLGVMARLSFSSSSLSFPDADPDALPQVPASPGSVTVTAKARATPQATVLLTVAAGDDLRSGMTTIPVDNLTWTATGDGFVGGTVSRVAEQVVASWTGSGIRTGTQEYFFRNLWTHPSGTYTVTLVYTLTAP